VYEREGKAREAQSLFEDVLVGRRRVLGDRHADTLRTQALLGRLHLRQRRYLNAERELSAALESYRTSGSETWQRYHCEALVGWALAALQRNAEAEGALRSGNEGLLRLASRIGAANWRYFEESEHALTDFYIRQRKPELLKSWTEEMSTNATVSAMTSEIDKRARLR
jgi:hypothetical protein